MAIQLYYQLFTGILLILIVFMLWKLRNFMKLYDEFPSYPLAFQIISALILRKTTSHIPIQSFLFQTLIHISEKFRKEGMYLFWSPQPHLVIFSDEAVKLFSNEESALDKPHMYEISREFFGTGMITSQTEDWKKQRKMLNPVFHTRMLKNKLSIFNENADILVEKLTESVNKPYINITEYIKPCTFSAICEYTMGLKMNRPENKEFIENCINIISSAGKMSVYRFAYPWFHYKFMMNFLPTGRKYLKDLHDGRKFIKKMILEMKEKISHESNEIKEDYPEDDEESRKSFSHILLDHHSKDSSFTIQDLESQVTTFLSAGYETVTFSIVWCLFMLGLHPEVQEQVYNEVLSIPKGHIKYEDLISLKYLDCVVKEILRLYPTVPVYGRRLSKEIQFGKYVVPKDTTIVFIPYALHRNPNVFPDPEKFIPERFMDDNAEKLFWNYTPFAEGIRYCIGKRFAILEMKVFLVHILRHFWIRSLDKQEEVNLSWEIVLAPVKPLRFQLTLR